jgi:hypothetical protein
MAGGAVRNLTDLPHFVFLNHLLRFMGMAARAHVCAECGGVAGTAIAIGILVVHGEGMVSTVRCRSPGVGGMTIRAARSKAPGMVTGFGVTGGALGWRSLVSSAGMTVRARCARMCAGEWEAGGAVIEVRPAPSAGRMAPAAIRTKGSVVDVVAPVTSDTRSRRALILPVHMTGSTIDLNMSPCERKVRLVVVHLRTAPTRRAVARATIGPERAIVNIIRLVAGDAGARSTGIGSICVAGSAGHPGVFPGERKPRI